MNDRAKTNGKTPDGITPVLECRHLDICYYTRAGEIPAVVDRDREHQGRSEHRRPQGGRDEHRRPQGGRDEQRNGSSLHDDGGGTHFVYIGVGAKAHVRPGDIVGAIANNTDLTGKQIGPIRISDHHSVVGVPAAAVDEVIRTMHGMHLRGKKAKARRYTG